MAIGLDSIWSSIQNGVTALNNLTTAIKSAFPQVTTSSTTAPATAGSITFTSSEAAGFMLIALSSGATVKVPYYNQ